MSAGNPRHHPRRFETPADLRNAAAPYFHQKCKGKREGEPTFTRGDLCRFIGIDRATWNKYKARKEFKYTIEKIERRLVNRLLLEIERGTAARYNVRAARALLAAGAPETQQQQ